jgi:dienelactone hydrolase
MNIRFLSWALLAVLAGASFAVSASCGAAASRAGGNPADDDAAADDDDNDDNDASPYYAPDEPGPFAVGVTTIYLTDKTRWEDYGRRFRQMPVEIWYPSSGQGGAPNTISAIVGEMPAWAMDILHLLFGDGFDAFWNLTTSASRGAAILADGAPYPLVLFSHGDGGLRVQNFTLCERLASHGFVVAAPDHYANAAVTNVPGTEPIIFDPTTMDTSYYPQRRLDIQFLAAQLSLINVADGPLHGLFDFSRLGMAGHSSGGWTTLDAGVTDDFLDGIAPLNGLWLAPTYPAYAKPMFMIQGERDTVIGAAENASLIEIFNDLASPKKIRLDFREGGHTSATNACSFYPSWAKQMSADCNGANLDPAIGVAISSAYLTAYFHSILMGDSRYDAYLAENHYPDEIDFTAVWP